MASGSFNLNKSSATASDSYIIGMIKWTSTANTAGNYSSVTATLYCKKANDTLDLTIPTDGSWAYTLTVNGKTKSGSVTKSILTSWVAIASYTVDKVNHATNGTKSITISGSVTAPTGTSFEGLKTSGSKSVALDSLSRASSVSATDANIGAKTAITISRSSSSFTHTLKYAFGGLSGTIATKTAETSISWTVPTSFYAQIPNAPLGKCTITCDTYNGSTKIGSNTCEFAAIAPMLLCAPTVSVVAEDANAAIVALTGSNKRILKGYSDIKVTTTATAKNSASISTVTVSCGSEKKTGTSVTFDDAGSTDIKATVKDSRGYVTEKAASGLTVVNYIKPTIKATISRESPTSDIVNISVTGNWFNGNFGAVANTLKVQVRYKPKSQAEYTDADLYHDLTITKNGNKYTASGSVTGLVYTQAYNIRIRVRDAVHEHQGPIADPIWKETEISKGVPVFDWGEDDFRFNVPIYSGGVNFTYIFQAESGAAGLGQGESATILNPTDNHRLYYVRPTISDGITPANVYIPCTRVGNMIMGVGGYPHASGRIDIFCVYITFATNGTLTVNYCGYWNTATQEYAQRKLNGVFAVL